MDKKILNKLQNENQDPLNSNTELKIFEFSWTHFDDLEVNKKLYSQMLDIAKEGKYFLEKKYSHHFLDFFLKNNANKDSALYLTSQEAYGDNALHHFKFMDIEMWVKDVDYYLKTPELLLDMDKKEFQNTDPQTFVEITSQKNKMTLVGEGIKVKYEKHFLTLQKAHIQMDGKGI